MKPVKASPRWGWIVAGVALALIGSKVAWEAYPRIGPLASFHYASNHNFGLSMDYLPRQAGFNLADVNSPQQLASLPEGVKGLVYVGQCDGVTSRFLKTVRPYLSSTKLYGFYLMDNPDPRSRFIAHVLSPACTAEHLNAESDFIHTHAPGAKTFMILMSLTSSTKPSFDPSYNPARLRVDLFGLDPYPCRSELHGCDYDMIGRYVTAAEADGVPPERIVPVYQTFGGGGWKDDGGGAYVLPTAAQERQILSRWRKLVARPTFDYAYSWGGQKHDDSLEGATTLRALFESHNRQPRGASEQSKITSAAYDGTGR